MDYLEFYGLEQEPFSSAPISRFYFNSAQHQRALVRLMYAVDTMKGLAVLIGEVGTGKTTLARRMLDSLPEEEYESALLVIIHSGITADWLLSRIARQLGVEDPAPEKLKLLNQLYGRLIELNEQGKKAVVLIDEAQMLHSKEIMEEFRGLLNLELNESKLITFVFFGLPDLEDHMQLDEPLAQRVSLKCKLESFTLESTEGYINHRLRLAGAKSQLFPSETVKIVHHYARGIPRLINTICDNSLFEGYLLKKKTIEPELMKSVVMDLGLAPPPKAKRTAPQAQPGQVLRAPGPFRQARPAPAAPPEQAYEEEAMESMEMANEPTAFAPEPTAFEESLTLADEPMALAKEPAAYEPPADLPPLEIPMALEDDGLPDGMSIEAVAEEPELPFLEESEDDIGLEIETVPDEPALADPNELRIETVEDDGTGDFDAMFDDATGGAQPAPKSEDDSNLDSLFDGIEEK